jgi:hypothetical protein
VRFLGFSVVLFLGFGVKRFEVIASNAIRRPPNGSKTRARAVLLETT